MKYQVTKVNDPSYNKVFDSIKEAQADIKTMTCEGILDLTGNILETPCGCQFKIEEIG